MDVKTMKIKQYNSTWKHLLIIDGEPVCIFESANRIAEALQYINGYDSAINDGHIKKILDKYRTVPNGKVTERKKKQKEKAIKKFSDVAEQRGA